MPGVTYDGRAKRPQLSQVFSISHQTIQTFLLTLTSDVLRFCNECAAPFLNKQTRPTGRELGCAELWSAEAHPRAHDGPPPLPAHVSEPGSQTSSPKATDFCQHQQAPTSARDPV